MADNISISALNPYNPFGINLNAASNLGWVTRRPLEAGPRVFTQDVNTWYFGTGLRSILIISLGFCRLRRTRPSNVYRRMAIAGIGLALNDQPGSQLRCRSICSAVRRPAGVAQSLISGHPFASMTIRSASRSAPSTIGAASCPGPAWRVARLPALPVCTGYHVRRGVHQRLLLRWGAPLYRKAVYAGGQWMTSTYFLRPSSCTEPG